MNTNSSKIHVEGSNTIGNEEIIETSSNSSSNFSNKQLNNANFMMQIKALMLKHMIEIKRTWFKIAVTIFFTLLISALGFIIELMVSSSNKEYSSLLTFDSFSETSNNIVVVADDIENKWWQKQYVDVISKMYQEETNNIANIKIFKTIDESDEYIHKVSSNEDPETKYVLLGFVLPDTFSIFGGNSITVMWNSSSKTVKGYDNLNETNLDFILVHKIELAMLTTITNSSNPIYSTLTKDQQKELERICEEDNFDHYSTLSLKQYELVASGNNPLESMSSMLILFGVFAICSTFMSNPCEEIYGTIRDYMQTKSLKLIPYWLTSFITDLIIYVIDIFLIWCLFCICGAESFTKNLGPTLYVLLICGPSLILFSFVLIFIFSNPETTARNGYILNILFLMLLFSSSMTSSSSSNIDLSMLAIFPPILFSLYFSTICTVYKYNTDGFQMVFMEKYGLNSISSFPFIDIVLYTILLIIIEKLRISRQRKKAKSKFENHSEFFKNERNKQQVTKEAILMEEKVQNNKNKYAVKIKNVSRLFLDSKDNPIPAVNNVSLGVKKCSIFGFLGANGAGKTTLINMITGILPVSDGSIEINGIDVTNQNDRTIISVCPQFNSHLCSYMTPGELLHFYSLLLGINENDEKESVNKLISILDLNDELNVPISDLSEGSARKVAIALSFLGNSKIILLDEPTATLDPFSMRKVHELILMYKGEKTFMLTTHLLDEAEALCDTISIMIRGRVFTCGSPSHLSAKFGTDYKIDIVLNDEDDTNHKVDTFFSEYLPNAELNIQRPNARIYYIPTSSIDLPNLFDIMEKGKNDDNGFKYFICASSSLEKVFIEIIRISEDERTRLNVIENGDVQEV